MDSKNRLVRLEAGRDLLEAIEECAEKSGIGSAAFIAIGGLRKARFGIIAVDEEGAPVEPTTYRPFELSKPNLVYELVSCVGNISKLGKETVVHAHVSVADSVDGKVYGGHLLPGTLIYPTVELAIIPTAGPAERKYDPGVRLNLLEVMQ